MVAILSAQSFEEAENYLEDNGYILGDEDDRWYSSGKYHIGIVKIGNELPDIEVRK